MLTTDRDGWGADDARVLGVPVRWTAVPTHLPGGQPLPRSTAGRMVATDDAVLFDSDDVRVLVRGTDEVLIEPRGTRAPADVAHFAYGFGARVLLLHAGRFSLHGTAVQTSAGVVVLAGDSGAGKSTTALALADGDGAGRILVDDVTPLRPQAGGVLVEPFARPIHLLGDALPLVRPDRLARVDRAFVAGPEGKAVFAFDTDTDDSPQVVSCLVVLETVPGLGPVPVTSALRGSRSLQWIVRLSNAIGVSSFGTRRDPYFRWATQVADAIPLWHVARDPEVGTLSAVVRVVRGLLEESDPETVEYGRDDVDQVDDEAANGAEHA